MNTNDIRRPVPQSGDFGFPKVDAMHAFAIATVSGGVFYYNFLKDKSQPSLLSATQDCAVFDDDEESEIEKDLSRPDISPCKGAFRTPPPKFRPYTSASMGVDALMPNELILLDSNYRLRLAQRRRLLLNYPAQTYASLPSATNAVSELHAYLFSHHLPRRFPEYFSLTPSGCLLQNKTSSNTYPIIPQSATNALRALGENLDEDMMILQSDGQEHQLSAFVCCFPSGFELHTKLGQPLSQIHKPLRGSDAPLTPLLTSLKPGVENAVCRFTWTIAPNSELFAPDQSWERNGEFDADKATLRVERLTLWKLPTSQAVVLGVKTYLTPLRDIRKDADDARALVQAIDALPSDIATAKGRQVWGAKLREYLST